MAVFPLYKTAVPYNAAELAGLDFAQRFDTMFLAHEYYETAKLVRSDHADWDYEAVSFGPPIDAPGAATATATVANESLLYRSLLLILARISSSSS